MPIVGPTTHVFISNIMKTLPIILSCYCNAAALYQTQISITIVKIESNFAFHGQSECNKTKTFSMMH